jgi:hypothetical protein
MKRAAQAFEVRLRGFSPRELTAQAEQRCAAHFGAERFTVEQARCVPCVCSIGGRVRLYEAHLVASPLSAPAPLL